LVSGPLPEGSVFKMIDFSKNNILTILSILILILGFQNCGNSAFQDMDAVQRVPVNSIITNDTKFRGGLDFTVMSLSDSSNDLVADFSVQRTEIGYRIVADLESYSCAFENPNASEELLQLTEITTISHPSMVGTAFDICDAESDKEIFYAVGEQSPIYLAFKDETEDCYSGDPQKLLDKGLRVFIVENLFMNDIQDLLDAVKQDVLNEKNCASFANARD